MLCVKEEMMPVSSGSGIQPPWLNGVLLEKFRMLWF
jgi:hypothetical protein